MKTVRLTRETLVAGALLVLGVVYGVLAVGEGLGSLGDTGAGFFPLIVAVVLVAASATVLVQGRREPEPAEEEPAEEEEEEEEEEDDRVHWWRIAGVLAAALLVPVIGETVGMIVTLSAALVLIAKIMGVRRWLNALILGVAFGAATWLLFVYWLFVPLPAGTLGLV